MKTANEMILEYFENLDRVGKFGVYDLLMFTKLSPLLHAYGEQVKEALVENVRAAALSANAPTNFCDFLAATIRKLKLP